MGGIEYNVALMDYENITITAQKMGVKVDWRKLRDMILERAEFSPYMLAYQTIISFLVKMRK